MGLSVQGHGLLVEDDGNEAWKDLDEEEAANGNSSNYSLSFC